MLSCLNSWPLLAFAELAMSDFFTRATDVDKMFELSFALSCAARFARISLISNCLGHTLDCHYI